MSPVPPAASPTPLTLDVVSDVVCPWCYVGKKRLENALELLADEIKITVRWQPFELNPNMPLEGEDRVAYLAKKFGSKAHAEELYANVAANAAADGLSIHPEKILRMPNSRSAHRLIWFAEQCGKQDAMVEGLFKAYFTDGEDIGDHGVLTNIAVKAGLDQVTVEAFLASDEAKDIVQQAEDQAHELGINGVPSFLLNGRYLFSGAQSPETISLAIKQAVAKGRVN